MFSWANKQLEYLAETMAPMSATSPSHRFLSYLSKKDEASALACLNGPFTEENPPMDPHEILNTIKGYQAIHLACQHCAVQVIKSLITQHGARVDTFDYQGNTALHYAVNAIGGTMKTVDLVKMLVKDYDASVTVKNAQGQTPYDVSADTLVRQYLLPIQLQQETQECLDQGGKGLPAYIDMGGYKPTQNTNIAPPPTSGFMSSTSTIPMNPTPANSAYEDSISMLMAPPPMTKPETGSTATYPPVASPGLTTVALSPDKNMPSATVGGSANVTPSVSLPLPPVSNSPEVHSTNTTSIAPSDPEPTAPMTSQPTPAPTPGSTPASTPAPTSIPDTQQLNIADSAAPLQFPPPPLTSSQPRSFMQQSNPHSSSTPSFPLSSSNPQPPRTLIKPDGFHSSASDPNLQKKYGHIKKTISIDPPPISKSMHPPPIYGGINNGNTIQNRYLSYDAVTGKASLLQGRFPPPPITTNGGASASQTQQPLNSSAANEGYNYNRMRPPPLSNVKVFNPATSNSNR